MGLFLLKIYDKCDDFDFDIVNFPFLDGDGPRRASYTFRNLLCFQRAKYMLKQPNFSSRAIGIINFEK